MSRAMLRNRFASVQALEQRMMLSVTAGLSGSNTLTGKGVITAVIPAGAELLPIRLTSRGTLLVQGDLGTDIVRINRSGGSIKVSADLQAGIQKSATFSAKDVKRIYVDTGAGRDQIFLGLGVMERATLIGGTGDDTIVGGLGPATINGGAGDDLLSAGDLSGNVAVRVTSGAQGGANWSTAGTSNSLPILPALIYGGLGDDTIAGSPASDTIIGGGGRDTYRSTVLVVTNSNLFGSDQVSEVETLQFGKGGNRVVIVSGS